MNFDMQAWFEEQQSASPKEDRAATREQQLCLNKHEHLRCTKPLGHQGEHAAHGALGLVIARWEP